MDAALSIAKENIEQRNKNLDFFGNLSYSMLSEIVKAAVASDPRLSYEERNKGFFLKFNDSILFRVSVNAHSERGEILVNRERVIIFYGNEASETKDFEDKGTVHKHVYKCIMDCLHNELSNYYQSQLEKL